jgi:hypothetical protein
LEPFLPVFFHDQIGLNGEEIGLIGAISPAINFASATIFTGKQRKQIVAT